MNSLITQSLKAGDVALLLNFPTQLMSKAEKGRVEWIMTYLSRFGSPPTLNRMQEEFDTFLPIESKDPLADIYERTLQRKRNLYVREYMMAIQEDLKAGADPLPHIEKLHSEIRGGGSEVTRYTRFDRTVYYRRPTAYPYEIGQLDKFTGGISQGDLIYLIGRLGTGKTTFALWVLNKWLQRGRKILMVSNENRADDVVAKIDSYIGGFNPIKKRTMQWTSDDLDRLNTVSFIAQHMEGEVFIPNKPVQDVKEVQSLIYAYRPDIVMVDGIYLMQGVNGTSHWEKITEISRSLKQLADGEGVPILGIHQANRNAIGKRMEVEHIAYADALAQDADVVMGLNAEEDGSIFVECLKSRWGSSGWGMFVKFHFDTMSARILDGATTTGDEE